MSPTTLTGRSANAWEERVQRCEVLTAESRPALDVLRFYRAVLQVQASIAERSAVVVSPDRPLREQIDVPHIVDAYLPDVLSVAETRGTQSLAEDAQRLRERGRNAQCELMLQLVLQDDSAFTSSSFVARACLQPIAEQLQRQLPEQSTPSSAHCPVCAGLPQLSVLRPMGDGAERSLLCSFCLREWVYRRVLCPACGETNREKLPRYSAEGCVSLLIEACDTCKKYVKAVDLSADGRAVPLVDEVAMAALDVWAVQQGYTKVISNLMGF